jgi:hypothetical protein
MFSARPDLRSPRAGEINSHTLQSRRLHDRDSALTDAAALSVLALLAVLVRRGLVRIERAMVPRAIYRPARSNYFLSTTASSAASKPAILRGLAPKS